MEKAPMKIFSFGGDETTYEAFRFPFFSSSPSPNPLAAINLLAAAVIV